MPLDYALARQGDKKKRLALVPHNTNVDDEITLLAGSGCPFVVRRKNKDRFELVGDCYIYGMMEGEEMARGCS